MSVPMNSAKASSSAELACVSAEPVMDFADWMDRQLADLEAKFAGFVTRDSLKQSLKGLRQSRETSPPADGGASEAA
jgi:hypothetical protein